MRSRELGLACDQIDELMSDLIEGELPETARAGVQSHIAACERCGPAYKSLKRTVRFVRAQAGVDLRPGTPGGAYMEFTQALAQGDPERAINAIGRGMVNTSRTGGLPPQGGSS